jgi:protein arginine kinase activator
MHKGVSHKGKVPSRAARAEAFQTKLKSLHSELQAAVQSENYEAAASLRDQISNLEVQLKS